MWISKYGIKQILSDLKGVFVIGLIAGLILVLLIYLPIRYADSLKEANSLKETKTARLDRKSHSDVAARVKELDSNIATNEGILREKETTLPLIAPKKRQERAYEIAALKKDLESQKRQLAGWQKLLENDPSLRR